MEREYIKISYKTKANIKRILNYFDINIPIEKYDNKGNNSVYYNTKYKVTKYFFYPKCDIMDDTNLWIKQAYNIITGKKLKYNKKEHFLISVLHEYTHILTINAELINNYNSYMGDEWDYANQEIEQIANIGAIQLYEEYGTELKRLIK